jgi:hypothetical protein
MAEGKDTRAGEQVKEPGKRSVWWKRLWRWTEFGMKTGWAWLEPLTVLTVITSGTNLR